MDLFVLNITFIEAKYHIKLKKSTAQHKIVKKKQKLTDKLLRPQGTFSVEEY
jgi:hypothetical protein